MKKNILGIITLSFLLTSCYDTKSPQSASSSSNESTAVQEKLQEEGWEYETPTGGEFDESYGVKPVYGLQDNYFDITVGKGFNVAIKIMNASTNKCIRYVYVPENQTVTVNEIPQGLYYLKLAYGQDWMCYKTDSTTMGKFSKTAFYERSIDTYNFGRKNSQDFVNYELKINVIDGSVSNNFETQPIKEQEFLRN